MKNIIVKAFVGVVIIAVGMIAIPAKSVEIKPNSAANAVVVRQDQQHVLDTYLSALEWCESAGKQTALNAKDLDGTPSYSNYQWKPLTFLTYAKQYGLIPKTTILAQVPELLKDYALQRATVEAMSQDKSVNWIQQFPGCTKKLGYPPQVTAA